jgi:CheY-like chemotaxis protein
MLYNDWDCRHAVLLVNDKPDILKSLALQVRQTGYRILTALDGREAFQIAQVALPDLIISDVAMSGVDGIELCRLIRAHPLLRFIPLLLIGGLSRDSGKVAEAFRAGADDYLQMPCKPESFVSAIARLIEREP